MENIEFEKMSAEHLELWNEWIKIPHVKDVWFIEGYEPAQYMAQKLTGNGYDFPFIIYLDQMPLGFIQACDLYAYRTICPEPKGVFCQEEPGTFCLDLFIAEKNLLGKGYGTKIVRAFTKKLRDEFKAKKILIDPAADNMSAIRCYEKAGFKKIKMAYDGICRVVIMEWQPDMSVRNSIRVILLNHKNELVLLKADDPKTTTTNGWYNGPFWFTVGGEIEPSETEGEAALREIYEETGIRSDQVKLGPIVWQGQMDLILTGKLTKLKQRFIVAKATTANISLSNLTAQERPLIKDIRWFSLEQIETSKEIIYPICLKRYLPAILDEHYPDPPIEIDVGENPKFDSRTSRRP